MHSEHVMGHLLPSTRLSPRLVKTLLHQQRARANTTNAIDWNQHRDKWPASIEDVFQAITQWLRVAGLPRENLERGERTITEETLGRYDSPILTIRMPNFATIAFTPIASVIVGGYVCIEVAPNIGWRSTSSSPTTKQGESRAVSDRICAIP